jgi:hypothetical protein
MHPRCTGAPACSARVIAWLRWPLRCNGAVTMINRRASLLVLLVCLGFACNKKVTASNEFKAAMEDFKPAMQAFTRDFPKHEVALQQLRDEDPAAARRTIEEQVLPLIDAVATALARAHDAGSRYVEVATDEDPGMIAKIRKNVEQLDRQRQGFQRVRDAYADQAKQLARGRLTDADSVAFVNAVQEAMQLVAN